MTQRHKQPDLFGDRDPHVLAPIAFIMLLRGNKRQQEEALRYLGTGKSS